MPRTVCSIRSASTACARFPVFGRVVWGARTLRGADAAADEYKYMPVRRRRSSSRRAFTAAPKWVVFEPNDEPLWAQIRLNIGAFMHNLFRQGAFQGKTPREAYFVKCDKETTTQNDINLGIVNIVVGFAPLKPAEFVIIKLQQMAGQIARREGGSANGTVHRQCTAFRSLQEFQVPRQVGWPLCRRRQQGRRAQAHDRSGRAPRRRRSEQQPQVARAAPSTRPSRSSAASPTTPSSRSGRTRCGTSAPGLGAEVSLKDFRKDIIIEIYNEAGQLVIAYKVFRCWVSEFQAQPDLDANANAVAIQTIKLENEGWERDYAVAEPSGAEFRRAVSAVSRDDAHPVARHDTRSLGTRLPLAYARPGAARARSLLPRAQP